jgi:beta-phosphoglucomutase family hydrolase
MDNAHAWAAIFDWDGVIIDSSRQHDLGWQALARECGKTLPPGFFLKSFGMKNQSVIPELLQWTQDPQEIERLSRRKEVLYRELVRRDGIGPLPGVLPFLDQLAAAGVPCAVASSTPRENIDRVIDTLNLRRYFKAIIAAEDVHHGKPHPEVFLLAAGKLDSPPARSLVFEDAHVGIEAARHAAMKVIAVATTHPADSLRGADRVVRRLDELTLDAIECLLFS